MFIEAKDDGGGEWWQLDYWSYKSCIAPVKSSPTNQHPVFYSPDALPVAQPTMSKHWREQSTEVMSVTVIRSLICRKEPTTCFRVYHAASTPGRGLSVPNMYTSPRCDLEQANFAQWTNKVSSNVLLVHRALSLANKTPRRVSHLPTLWILFELRMM